MECVICGKIYPEDVSLDSCSACGVELIDNDREVELGKRLREVTAAWEELEKNKAEEKISDEDFRAISPILARDRGEIEAELAALRQKRNRLHAQWVSQRVACAARFLEADRLDEAYQTMQQALNVDPANPAAYMIMARILSYMGRPEDAIRAARYAYTLDPTNHEIENYVAQWEAWYQGMQREKKSMEAQHLGSSRDTASYFNNLAGLKETGHQSMPPAESPRLPKGSYPFSTGKGVAVVVLLLLCLMVFGSVCFLGFSFYYILGHSSVISKSLDSRGFADRTKYDRYWKEYMQRMLYVGIVVLLSIMVVCGFTSGLIFGRHAWLVAFLSGLIFVLIIIPFERKDWITYSTGLSFGPAYVAAILGPLIAAIIAFIVSEIGVWRGWRGIQLRRPYASMIIGAALYFPLILIILAK